MSSLESWLRRGVVSLKAARELTLEAKTKTLSLLQRGYMNKEKAFEKLTKTFDTFACFIFNTFQEF